MPTIHCRGPIEMNRLVRIVEAEFREVPSMRLTAAQAQRLGSMSQSDCAEVLGRLAPGVGDVRNHIEIVP